MHTTPSACQSCNKPLQIQEAAPGQSHGPITCRHCGHVQSEAGTQPGAAVNEEFSGSTQVLRVGVQPALPPSSSIDVTSRLNQATQQFGHGSAKPGTKEGASSGQAIKGQWHPATAAAIKDIADSDDFAGNHTTALRVPPLADVSAGAHKPLTADLFQDALEPAEPEASVASAARSTTPISPSATAGSAQPHRPSVTLFEASAIKRGNTWLKVILAIVLVVVAGVGLALVYLHKFAPKKLRQDSPNQVVVPAPAHLLSNPARPTSQPVTH